MQKFMILYRGVHRRILYSIKFCVFYRKQTFSDPIAVATPRAQNDS